MKTCTFKEAVCDLLKVQEATYDKVILKSCLTNRARIFFYIISALNPNFFFNERRLVKNVSKALSMKEIKEEVDFYQHKYVANFMFRDTFRFRLSGIRLISLGQRAFKHAQNHVGDSNIQ